jgi:predicted metal-dependent hydrolase
MDARGQELGLLPEDDPTTSRVIPRQVTFDLNRAPRYWHSGSPFLTHFFTALSVVFPEGERFFIASVRHFESEIEDPRLRSEVRDFIRQEAQHGFQHRIYNAFIEEHGVHAKRVDAANGRIIRAFSKIFSPKTQLAITIALEHMTAILANQMLTNPKLSAGMHPDMKPLWLWHAMEETEHKAVCFDAYQAIDGGHFRRIFVMSRVMFGFPLGMLFLTFFLLARDGGKIFDLSDIGRGLRYLYGRDGFIRSVFPEIRAYFRRDFHPWDCANAHLVSEWSRDYGHYSKRMTP